MFSVFYPYAICIYGKAFSACAGVATMTATVT